MTTQEIRDYTHAHVHIWSERVPAHADEDGTVRVYDSVAGHFTACHSLTEAQQRHVRAAAKRAS